MINKPVISCGSAKSIGYEVLVRVVGGTKIDTEYPLYAVGSKNVLDFYIRLLNLDLRYSSVKYKDFSENIKTDTDLVLIDIDDFSKNINSLDAIDSIYNGKIGLASVNGAADLVKNKIFSSLVTLPVDKESINILDNSFKGHTEYLCRMWEQSSVYMTFISDKISVLLLSTHVSLSKVPELINEKNVYNGLTVSCELYKKMGFKKPICFLGLNPHAGENGIIGKEELFIKEIIFKVVDKYGIEIIGPIPADTAFIPSNISKYSLFVSCYHDQGLIPFKMLSFNDGVNLSYGMDYIRTSVDHGTGVDLIGKNMAGIDSFVNAYELAVKLT